MCMRHTVVCFLPPLYNILLYFSTLSHKRYDFRKKKLQNKKCEFRFSVQLMSETFLILRINERDMIRNVYWSSRKVPFILCSILITLGFSLQIFGKIFKYPISWKSVQWEPRCFTRTYGQTWSGYQSLFAILRTRLKSDATAVNVITLAIGNAIVHSHDSQKIKKEKDAKCKYARVFTYLHTTLLTRIRDGTYISKH